MGGREKEEERDREGQKLLPQTKERKKGEQEDSGSRQGLFLKGTEYCLPDMMPGAGLDALCQAPKEQSQWCSLMLIIMQFKILLTFVFFLLYIL